MSALLLGIFCLFPFICLLAAGALRARFEESKGRILGVTLLLLGLWTPLALIEGGFRVRHYLVRGIGFTDTLQQYKSSRLGWPARSESLGEGEKTILLIGDSFSEGMGYPTEQLYAAHLARELSFKVELRAGRGYGTLQELFLLEDSLKELRPDLVLLQMSSNDLINNSFELESRSYLQNALSYRPYLIDGKVQSLFPSDYPVLQHSLAKNFRSAHFLSLRLQGYLAEQVKAGNLSSIEHEIIQSSGELAEFRQAVKLTKSILERFQQQLGEIPFILLLADETPVLSASLAELSSELGTQLLRPAEPPLAASLLHPDGSHWNPAGQAEIASRLSAKLRIQ